jgi:hypothetical protein
VCLVLFHPVGLQLVSMWEGRLVHRLIEELPKIEMPFMGAYKRMDGAWRWRSHSRVTHAYLAPSVGQHRHQPCLVIHVLPPTPPLTSHPEDAPPPPLRSVPSSPHLTSPLPPPSPLPPTALQAGS